MLIPNVGVPDDPARPCRAGHFIGAEAVLVCPDDIL